MALKSLLLVALVTAAPATCSLPGQEDDGVIDDISPAALAALPPGVDPAFLIRDENGCYGISIEAADPPTGPPLIDASGLPVCDVAPA